MTPKDLIDSMLAKAPSRFVTIPGASNYCYDRIVDLVYSGNSGKYLKPRAANVRHRRASYVAEDSGACRWHYHRNLAKIPVTSDWVLDTLKARHLPAPFENYVVTDRGLLYRIHDVGPRGPYRVSVAMVNGNKPHVNLRANGQRKFKLLSLKRVVQSAFPHITDEEWLDSQIHVGDIPELPAPMTPPATTGSRNPDSAEVLAPGNYTFRDPVPAPAPTPALPQAPPPVLGTWAPDPEPEPLTTSTTDDLQAEYQQIASEVAGALNEDSFEDYFFGAPEPEPEPEPEPTPPPPPKPTPPPKPVRKFTPGPC
jgi:hypothetical protein